MTVTEMRRSAEIAQEEGVPLEMNPADVLALLDEVERLRAKLAARLAADPLRAEVARLRDELRGEQS